MMRRHFITAILGLVLMIVAFAVGPPSVANLEFSLIANEHTLPLTTAGPGAIDLVSTFVADAGAITDNASPQFLDLKSRFYATTHFDKLTILRDRGSGSHEVLRHYVYAKPVRSTGLDLAAFSSDVKKRHDAHNTWL
jgi:hypothetical protein